MSRIANLSYHFLLYRRMIGMSIRSQMQYRTSFLMMTFGQFGMTLIEFMGVWSLFSRFGNLRGWQLAEVALFYGVVSIAFALAEGFARGFDTFSRLIVSGDFDRLLLRPCSTVFQVACREVQVMRVGRLIQGCVVLTFACTHLTLHWTLAKVLLILFTLVAGAFLFTGLMVLQAVVAFWTIESLEVFNIFTYGGVETGQYPLTIYRPWLKWGFTFVVPIACINYLPLGLVFEKHDLLQPQSWHYFAPTMGILFFLASLQLWKLGERYYLSTGN